VPQPHSRRRLDTSTSFRKEEDYAALKRAIAAMDIYDHAREIRVL